MNTMKILVVDDERDVRVIISQICRDLGFVTEEAANGEEAWTKLNHDSYDLVILDICMPLMDGLQLLKKIRNANLPLGILLLSGFMIGQPIVLDPVQGADDFLTKPFNIETLEEKVRDLLKPRVQREPKIIGQRV